MRQVKFIKEKIHTNGKPFRVGQVIVLDGELLNECLEEGYAVLHNEQPIPDEILKELKKKKK